MAVIAYHVTQYHIWCDECGVNECCPDSLTENAHSKREAIKWAGMHQTRDGLVLCDKCFKAYKQQRNKR